MDNNEESKRSTVAIIALGIATVLLMLSTIVFGALWSNTNIELDDLTEQAQVLQTDNERALTEKAQVEDELETMTYWEDKCFTAATLYKDSARELALSVQEWLDTFPNADLDLSEATALVKQGDATECLE